MEAGRDRERIAIYAGFSEGHAFPGMALARALRARGHEVALEIAERWREPATELGARFSPAARYVTFPGAAPGQPGPTAADVARARAASLAELRPAVVVSDLTEVAATLAAELAGIPNATLIPTAYPVQAPGLPPYLSGIRPPRGRLGRAAWRVAEPATRPLRHSARWLRRVPALLDELRSELGLPALGPEPGPVTTYGTISERLALVATFPQLEHPRRWPPGVEVTGPMLFELPHPPTELPPGDEPLVLVAPSTVHETADELIELALRALAREPLRVVATLNRRGRDYAGPVPANAVVVDWLSYAELMPRASAAIVTGGHGTVVRALADGLPLLVCPAGADTAENGARVRWAGVGTTLPRRRRSAAAVRSAVRALLDEPGPRARAGELAAWARAHDGAVRGAELIEGLAAAQPR